MKAIRCVGLVTAVAALGLSATTRAGEHVVTPETSAAALQQAAAQHDNDRAELEALLSSPAAEQAAARGLDVAAAREAVASLSQDELADLAARARELRADPAAGLGRDVEDMLVIFLLVALVILVLKAV
jgi:hypothetical protein